MNYIIYDLEATCWDPNPPGLVQEIIEIGALRLNDYAEIIGSYNRFVKPIINPFLSPFCKSLTSIQQEDVDRASTFGKVIVEFQEWAGVLDEEYLLCSWGSFDAKALQADCILHKIDTDWIPDNYINLKSQYQEMKKLRRPCGLKSAVKKEGFEFTGIHHRGISDAENLTKIFQKYMDVWQFQ